ncbi:MAG: hypothetical protein ACI8Q6_001851 [Granulosicoccus sp.]|jgi:hypothetical protein
MKLLYGGNVQRFTLDQIEIGKRLRTVREDAVENLIMMAEDTGITIPVLVRKVAKRHELIDGAHRMEAVLRLGLSDIAALVWDCRADEARGMEASNNLGAARMTVLQTVVFVASWKRDYYYCTQNGNPACLRATNIPKSWWMSLCHSPKKLPPPLVLQNVQPIAPFKPVRSWFRKKFRFLKLRPAKSRWIF